MMTAYILWYSSNSHKKDRFFVGVEKTPCKVHGFHNRPSWTYEKSGATILDASEGPTAKAFAEECGYKELKLEPIDETPSKESTPTEVKAPSDPVAA
jgi:hypothetical protein